MQWMVIDDTRTGLQLDASTGEALRPRGIRSSDVLHVQARNYAMAAAYGLEYVLADPRGAGALLDAAMWRRLGALAQAWQDLHAPPAQEDKSGSPLAYAASVACVWDEDSLAFLRADGNGGGLPRAELRAALGQAGVRVRWERFEDLLVGNVKPSRLYVFPELYAVSNEQRVALHGILAEQGAAALWLYAPGAATGAPPEEAVSALTRFPVRRFEEPARSGSRYAFDAELFSKDEGLGVVRERSPLFYIHSQDNEEIGVLANYAETQKTSAAIRFLEEGWASIYVAEPALPPELLRQVLRILEEPFTVPIENDPFPVSYIGRRFVGLHGRSPAGAHIPMRFTQPCDVYDMLDESLGWPNKRSLSLPLDLGETRMLRLVPLPQTAQDSETLKEDLKVLQPPDDAEAPAEEGAEPAQDVPRTPEGSAAEEARDEPA
jgi:hypothetical protein